MKNIMNNENECPMWFGRNPARLTKEEVGRVLGFTARDITTLTSSGILKPLGKPTKQMIKYYATAGIERLVADEKWLNKATRIIQNTRIEQELKKAKITT